MNNFTQYNFEIFNAFVSHQKKQDIVDKKKYIINSVEEFYNISVDNYLFVGFNPAILGMSLTKKLYITEVEPSVVEWLKSNRINVTVVDKITDMYDCIVATEEYLTYVGSETDQIDKIKFLCNHANDLLITTVKDYKNQDFKEREYSQPAVIRNKDLMAYVEMHEWSHVDRNAWQSYLYRLEKLNSRCIGEWQRRTLYFKQFAKFAYDAGASDFVIHKNIMYKSILKKNYEHVISVRFEQ
jgi:hypothetical protein